MIQPFLTFFVILVLLASAALFAVVMSMLINRVIRTIQQPVVHHHHLIPQEDPTSVYEPLQPTAGELADTNVRALPVRAGR